MNRNIFGRSEMCLFWDEACSDDLGNAAIKETYLKFYLMAFKE